MCIDNQEKPLAQIRYERAYVDTPDDWPYPLPHTGMEPQETVNRFLVDNGDPYLFHSKGGSDNVYLGLSVDDQGMLARIRRPPGRTPKGILLQQRTARREDYDKLVLACTESLIKAWDETDTRMDRISTYLKLPYNFRRFYDKSFPRVFILAYSDWYTFASVKTDKLLNWLHDKGYCTYTARELRSQIWQIMRQWDRMDFLYEIAAPISIMEGYASIVEEGEAFDRTRKGRDIVAKYRKRKKKNVPGDGKVVDNVVDM